MWRVALFTLHVNKAKYRLTTGVVKDGTGSFIIPELSPGSAWPYARSCSWLRPARFRDEAKWRKLT